MRSLVDRQSAGRRRRSRDRAREIAREGGRKFITILFADVAGFTSMSERLDPEEADEIMRPCFELMRETVHRYGGTVSQFLGDGIMALFGAPLAQEDHAERGVLAALSIQRALKEFERELVERSGISVRMRIGLNWAHRFEEAQRWAEIARDAAVKADSAALLAGTLYAVAFMAGLTGNVEQGRVAADEAIEARRRPGGEALEVGAPLVRGLFHHWDGEEAEATEFFDQMLQASRRPERSGWTR